MGAEDRNFTEFLAGGEEKGKPEIAIIGIGVEGPAVIAAKDTVSVVLSDLVAIEMLAKDLHYRANGKPFYAIHQLADFVWQIRRFRDDLNEVYWMGEKESVPPTQTSVFRDAIRQAASCEEIVRQEFAGDSDENIYLQVLIGLLRKLSNDLETAKTRGGCAGTGAVIDEISKFALQSIGLLKRTVE